MLPWATRCHADCSGPTTPGTRLPADRMIRVGCAA
jgi:hypothetical protein